MPTEPKAFTPEVAEKLQTYVYRLIDPRNGETFYAHNLGLPELREEVAKYASRLHGKVASNRIAITSGGVNALMLAVQMLVDAGDEVVAVTPVWPNLTAQPLIMGAKLRRVSLVPKDGAWTLDLQRLIDAITPATRLLVINAPNNPTARTRTPQRSRDCAGYGPPR